MLISDDLVSRIWKTGSVPAGRMLFGSHFPYFHLESAVLKLRESDLPTRDAEAITRKNAEQLLDAEKN